MSGDMVPALVSNGAQALLAAFGAIKAADIAISSWKRRRSGDKVVISENEGQTTLVADLQKAWEITRSDNVKLNERLDTAINELRDAAKENGELRGTVKALNSKIELLQDQYSESQKIIESLRSEISQLREQLKTGTSNTGKDE